MRSLSKMLLGCLLMSLFIGGLLVGTQYRRDYIYDQGRRAGESGLPATACPYTDDDPGAYKAWKDGWAEGYRQRGTP